MKIMLIMPMSLNPKQTYREYPLGLGYIGTVLQQEGHDVLIHDQIVEETTYDEIVAKADFFNPDVIGISLITPNYPIGQYLIHKLKSRNGAWPIIAGGIHATLFPEDIIHDGADCVVIGEAEGIISMLIKMLVLGGNISEIPGIVFKDRLGSIHRTSGQRKKECASPVIVDRSLFNLPLYSHHSILASRGCPYKCTFCCNYSRIMLTKGVSVRPYRLVVDELDVIENNFGGRQVFFADDIFLVNRKRILSFCRDYLETNLSIEWIGQMRVDTIHDDVAYKMREANCKRIYFGIESGSEEILKRIKKGITKDTILSGIAIAKNAGIRVKTGWLYGLPGSFAEQLQSIELMLEARPHEISIHQLIPFPGTEYYNNPTKYGIRIKDPKDFASFCYGGVSGNISFDYLSESQYHLLLEKTSLALDAAGYVPSDRAGPDDEYIYTTPMSLSSINAFRSLV